MPHECVCRICGHSLSPMWVTDSTPPAAPSIDEQIESALAEASTICPNCGDRFDKLGRVHLINQTPRICYDDNSDALRAAPSAEALQTQGKCEECGADPGKHRVGCTIGWPTAATPQHARHEGRWYYCWLIERRDGPQPTWLGEWSWEADANKAIWYARESDAEAARNHQLKGVRNIVVCEHGFMLERAAAPDDSLRAAMRAGAGALLSFPSLFPTDEVKAREAHAALLERAAEGGK